MHRRQDRNRFDERVTKALSLAQSAGAPIDAVKVVPASGAWPRPCCSLTIDVEDWYQSSVDIDAPITERVVRNVETILELADETNVKCSFFVQGMVAEAFPRLVATMVDEGHEVQSHGYSHRPLYAMDRATLRDELERARKTVEDACGVAVTSFRAPDFSIRRDNLWALEELAAAGFEIDSSIFPVETKRYGIGDWPLTPTKVSLAGGAEIVEVPVVVWGGRGWRLPVAGGGYFRLLPQAMIERALRSVVGEGRPAIVYCHPYEFNPTELDDYRGSVPLRFRLHQGLGRRAFTRRVRHLLAALPFGRMDEVLNGWWAR